MACEGFMKGFLFIINIIFFVIGSAALAVGIWIKVDKNHLLDLTRDVSGADFNDSDLPSLLDNAVTVLIIAGAFIFILGFLGGFGTIKNKSTLGKIFLKIYSTVVLMLLLLELAGVTVAWLFLDKAERKLSEYLDASLRDRYNGRFTSIGGQMIQYSSGGDPITLAWDVVQLQFQCCGRINGTDYISQPLYWDSYRSIEVDGVEMNMTVPPTCCEVTGGYKPLIADMKKLSQPKFSLVNPQCIFTTANDTIVGCYEEVKDAIINNSEIFIAIGCSAVGVELLCIILSCCLAKKDVDAVSVVNIEKDTDS